MPDLTAQDVHDLFNERMDSPPISELADRVFTALGFRDAAAESVLLFLGAIYQKTADEDLRIG